MAHPIGNENRADRVMKKRVAHIAGKAAGGSAHSDEAADRSLIRKMVKKSVLRADGGPVTARADKVSRAKGGRVKGTTVNVIVSPSKPDIPAAPPPMAAMPPPMPPKPPMAPPPAAPGPAMGAVPGMGGMPPIPPRSEGGRAYKRGGAVSDSSKGGTQVQHSGNKSDSQNVGRGPVITRATGGNVPTSGGRDRFEALERVGKGYQPPPPKRPERATGGPIYANGKPGAQMAWLKGVGAGGGKGRLKKARHEKSA